MGNEILRFAQNDGACTDVEFIAVVIGPCYDASSLRVARGPSFVEQTLSPYGGAADASHTCPLDAGDVCARLIIPCRECSGELLRRQWQSADDHAAAGGFVHRYERHGRSVADFVFLGVGTFLGGSVGVTGTLSYTTNGGGVLAIDRAGTFPLGVVTSNDMSLFKNASPGVNLGDVLVLSSGSVTTSANITAAAPLSGLYSAIFVDVNGVQLGVGTAVPAPYGDYNLNGLVDAADYVVWRKTDGTAGGYNVWRSLLRPTLRQWCGAGLDRADVGRCTGTDERAIADIRCGGCELLRARTDGTALSAGLPPCARRLWVAHAQLLPDVAACYVIRAVFDC